MVYDFWRSGFGVIIDELFLFFRCFVLFYLLFKRSYPSFSSLVTRRHNFMRKMHACMLCLLHECLFVATLLPYVACKVLVHFWKDDFLSDARGKTELNCYGFNVWIIERSDW